MSRCSCPLALPLSNPCKVAVSCRAEQPEQVRAVQGGIAASAAAGDEDEWKKWE